MEKNSLYTVKFTVILKATCLNNSPQTESIQFLRLLDSNMFLRIPMQRLLDEVISIFPSFLISSRNVLLSKAYSIGVFKFQPTHFSFLKQFHFVFFVFFLQLFLTVAV